MKEPGAGRGRPFEERERGGNETVVERDDGKCLEPWWRRHSKDKKRKKKSSSESSQMQEEDGEETRRISALLRGKLTEGGFIRAVPYLKFS